MAPIRVLDRLERILRGFRADTRGVSAVEFAMVLPLMVILFVGVVQVSELASLKRKTTLVARAVADLVSQLQQIDQAEMNNVMAAGTAVVAPYNTSKLKIRVTSVKIDGNKNATVVWSKVNGSSSDWSASSAGSPVALDAALKVPNTHLILGEARYSYNPSVGYGLTGALGLTGGDVSDKIYMRPRLSEKVDWK
ncbi:MAG: pilus assembly protein [Xanthobacteraceae bacterium]|nr:pilus assembly protein [Xanthobacteraceae bacterium]PWB60967.1 MAG: pilus assembly protein TadG [Bradyrhizobiaceae bacterium]